MLYIKIQEKQGNGIAVVQILHQIKSQISTRSCYSQLTLCFVLAFGEQIAY